jgi:hypothetical protein
MTASEGNSGFDTSFIAIELIVTVMWLLAPFAATMARSVWARGFALGLAIFGLVIVPMFWSLAFPRSSGIEGAGRIIMGLPFTLVQGLLSVLWALSYAARVERSKWSVAWPFAATIALNLLGWFFFW